MKTQLPPPSRLFLNTYMPLARSKAGRLASIRHMLPPFIDGSIRREPDLEHKQWPAITCLCRAGKFAPRLHVGDHVAYMTCTGHWHEDGTARPARHRRLTAILRVKFVCDSHEEAPAWYRKRALQLPSNIMVADNPAQPLEKSHRMTRFRCAMSDGKLHGTWDNAYKRRARKFKQVVICKPVFRSLGWKAPVVLDEDLRKVFDKLPGTQNPGEQPIELLEKLMAQLKRRTVHSPRR